MRFIAIFTISICGLTLYGCGATSEGPSGDVFTPASTEAEPQQGAALGATDAGSLYSIGELSYAGAFALPVAKNNVSSLNYASGVIEVNGDSLFIVGHDHHNAVAEFGIPELVNSTRIADLKSATARQSFVSVLDKAASNPESLDEIVGLEVVDGKLVINAVEYYDAPADNQLSTLVLDNASDLAGASAGAFRGIDGFARAAGWISAIPAAWQGPLGGTHITGYSSGGPIIGRYSVGPSAFAVDLEAAVQGTDASIPSSELLGFSLDSPLADDLDNESRRNSLWTHLSQARYGFIVPNTRTYMTIGWSGGHESGVGYKITQTDDTLCGGYCSYDSKDNYNFYWLWDLDDLLDAKAGTIAPDAIEPYESGRLELPFQADGALKPIGGASFDSTNNLLYVSLLRANTELGQYDNPPLIVAYRLQ